MLRLNYTRYLETYGEYIHQNEKRCVYVVKRFLVVFLSVLLLFSGTAFAAINGEYKGNPIVYVKVDGQKYSGNVPAVSLNGTTMVPVRFVSESLGADVKWDNASYTVNIISAANTASNNFEDKENLKRYATLSDYYKRLENLGVLLLNAETSFMTSFTKFATKGDTSSFKSSNDVFNVAIETFNAYLTESNYFVIDYPTEATIIKSILKNYSDSIDNYRSAFEGLQKSIINMTDESFEQYINGAGIGQRKALSGIGQAKSNYDRIYQTIQNY